MTAWERKIDERVYRLYGLTPEEIRIVEESLK
jgi:adenine-specific DNA-methyltransferase